MKSQQVVPENVDAYINSFPEDIQAILIELRTIIKEEAPEAEELISYNMPAYKLNGPLVYFAAFQNHIGFYAIPTGREAFKDALAKYKSGKGSVQFPIQDPLPVVLIREMVMFRKQENLKKGKAPRKKASEPGS